MHKTQKKQLCTKTGKDNIHYAQLKSATQEKKETKNKKTTTTTHKSSELVHSSLSLFFSSTSWIASRCKREREREYEHDYSRENSSSSIELHNNKHWAPLLQQQTDLLPALPAALLLQLLFLFPIPKCLKLLVVIKTQASLLSDMSVEGTWAQMRNFSFWKKSWRERKDIKGKLLSTYIICLQTHQLFFFGGAGGDWVCPNFMFWAFGTG